MKAGHEAENRFHQDAIEGLRHEYDRLRDRLGMLLDLRLDKSITQDEYDKKARELKERQTEIALRVEQHQKGEGDFRTTLESLISLGSRAAELFERSKAEQKRQLLAFVFSNLRPAPGAHSKLGRVGLDDPHMCVFPLLENSAPPSRGFFLRGQIE
jgi:hypothetical protein